MISERAPVEGSSTPVVMMKQVMEQPAPLSRFRAGIPEDLDRIVMRLLAKDPAHRFADGGSSGLQSRLADVTSVTQEARALSKEIGYVLAAADELRDIDGRP